VKVKVKVKGDEFVMFRVGQRQPRLPLEAKPLCGQA
jgi:hypothetical protein